MDMSKLPNLSNTPQPAENELPRHDPPSHRPDYEPQRDNPGMGAEVWLSFVIGTLLMLLGRSFASYLVARVTGQPYHTNTTWQAGPLAGQEVNYWDLMGFTALTDSGLFLFGLAMVLEGVALLFAFSKMRGKVPVVSIALFLACLATAYNFYVAARLLGIGIIPLFSGLAVAFGGYMAIYLWKLLRALRSEPVPST
jgi:hypothetical protein